MTDNTDTVLELTAWVLLLILDEVSCTPSVLKAMQFPSLVLDTPYAKALTFQRPVADILVFKVGRIRRLQLTRSPFPL